MLVPRRERAWVSGCARAACRARARARGVALANRSPTAPPHRSRLDVELDVIDATAEEEEEEAEETAAAACVSVGRSRRGSIAPQHDLVHKHQKQDEAPGKKELAIDGCSAAFGDALHLGDPPSDLE